MSKPAEETHRLPRLRSLLLAGGQSRRMGQCKAALRYHDQRSQLCYLIDLVTEMDIPVSVSTVKADRLPQDAVQYIADSSLDCEILIDSYIGIGPLGGILTGLKRYPDSALLVIACDLPLLGRNDLLQLINCRNRHSSATAYCNPAGSSMPEPMAAVYEPHILDYILAQLRAGVCSPRKILQTSSTTLINCNNELALLNVNYPLDYRKVQRIIHAKSIPDAVS